MIGNEPGVVGPAGADPVLRSGWKWLLGLGLVQAVLGIAVLSAPMMVAVVSAFFLGVLLLLAGALQLLHALRCRGWGGFGWHLAGGLLALLAGAWIAFFPQGGALGLVLVLGTFLVVAGIVRVVLALRVRPLPGWGGFLVAGLVGLLLGALVWSRPDAALWLLGVVVGFDLLLLGLTLALLAWRMRGS
jgi:uncharacterized membrane protein HdeD (DUF308 family)